MGEGEPTGEGDPRVRATRGPSLTRCSPHTCCSLTPAVRSGRLPTTRRHPADLSTVSVEQLFLILRPVDS